MRISTLTIFERAVTSMNRQQSEFIDIGRQMATGKRVVNPSDDPRAAARAVGLNQSLGLIDQFTGAREIGRNALSQEESVLGSISDAIATARTKVLQGVTGTLSDSDRNAVATEMKGILGAVLGQANAADASGGYLFGGFRDDSPPFVEDAAGAVDFVGDDNRRQLKVDNARLVAITDPGSEVFQSIQSGAGYIANAGDTNAGSVTFNGPLITDPTDTNFGTGFTIEFSENAGEMYYAIDGGTPQLYTEGEPVSMNGLTLELDGAPAAGDTIVADRAENLNTDLFVTLNKAIDVLSSPIETPTDQAELTNTLNNVLRELDNSLDNVLSVRASVGSRLNELDVIDSVSDTRELSYQGNLSDLIDLDYNKAVSDYSLRQVGLEAAQKTFVDINQMSLFNYLS